MLFLWWIVLGNLIIQVAGLVYSGLIEKNKNDFKQFAFISIGMIILLSIISLFI